MSAKLFSELKLVTDNLPLHFYHIACVHLSSSLPHHHTTTPPHHHTTTPPHCHTATPPHRHTATPPHRHTTPPHHHTTTPPHRHTATLPHRPSSLSPPPGPPSPLTRSLASIVTTGQFAAVRGWLLSQGSQVSVDDLPSWIGQIPLEGMETERVSD